MSNSKLTIEQKAMRKTLLEMLPAGSMLAMSETGVTFLTIPKGSVNEVYSATASPDEQKFRRKVGEYHALARWDDANPGTVVVPAFMDAAFLADAVDAQNEVEAEFGPEPEYDQFWTDEWA